MASVKFKMTVNHRMAMARLAKAEKAIEKAGHQTVADLVKIGKEKARSLVPRGDTGWLAGTIKGEQTKGARPYAKIYLNPLSGAKRHLPNSGKYPGSKFKLAEWMHATKGRLQSPNKYLLAVTKGRRGHAGDQLIRNGDPQFMFSTKKYLNSKKGTIAKNNFGNGLAIKAKTRF